MKRAWTGLLIAAAAVGGCDAQAIALRASAGGDPVKARSVAIARADLGADWPFTVDTAVLVCLEDSNGYGQYVVTGSTVLAVTGAAATLARQLRITIEIDGTPQQPRLLNADQDWPEGLALWAEAERPADWPQDEPWGRVSVAPLSLRLDRFCRAD